MSSAAKRVQQWATFARVWHVYDVQWQDPFEAGRRIGHYLSGLYKPIYHPLNDCGDHVVVVNSRDIAMRGDEWTKRVYFHHTGYPGGASWTKAWELHEKDPTMVLWKAVYGSIKGNLLRRAMMQRLHIYPDTAVPPEILENISNQIRQTRPVPKRLDHYTKEEVEKFPKVFDYPEDHIMK